MRALRIKGWEKHYENNRSRELRRPEWLPLPNKFDGTGFMELMDHPAGMSHYGAWCLLLGAASRQPLRGLFVTDSGKAMSIRDIARMTRGSAKVFEEALPRFLAIGWVEEVEVEADISADDKRDNARSCASGQETVGHDDAGTSQPSAGIPQQGATEVRLNKKGNWNKNMNEAAAAAAASKTAREQPQQQPPPWAGEPKPAEAGDPLVARAMATDPDPNDITSPDPPPVQVVRARTFGDFQAQHPRIFVARDERESWEATLTHWGWEAMSEAYHETAKKIQRDNPRHRVLLSMVTEYLDAHFEVTQ